MVSKNNVARKRSPVVSNNEKRQPMSPSNYNNESLSRREDDINDETVGQDQVVELSPVTRILISHQMITPRAEDSNTDLMKENEM